MQKARFEKGKELLEAEFRNLLTRYSKPVPPILILDAISVDEELEVQEEVVLEHLPEAVLQDIICIAGWLVEYGRNQGATSSLLRRDRDRKRGFRTGVELLPNVCFCLQIS